MMSPLTSGDSEETSDWDVGVGRVCEGQEWERIPLTSMLPTSFSSGVHWCGWASCFRYRLVGGLPASGTGWGRIPQACPCVCTCQGRGKGIMRKSPFWAMAQGFLMPSFLCFSQISTSWDYLSHSHPMERGGLCLP